MGARRDTPDARAQNKSVATVDPVLASRFCAWHVSTVQRPGKSTQIAEAALEEIKSTPGLEARTEYHRFLKIVSAHCFDVWTMLSRGTFRMTLAVFKHAQNILSDLFATSTIPIESGDRFWVKVRRLVQNAVVIEAVIGALTLYPDVRPLSHDVLNTSPEHTRRFFETAQRLLYDNTQIVTWALDSMMPELLDPVHESVRRSMWPLFSEKRVPVEDSDTGKQVCASYLLTTSKFADAMTTGRSPTAQNAMLIQELAEKIHSHLRDAASKPSLYTIQGSLMWMQKDFLLRTWHTTTTYEQMRAGEPVRATCGAAPAQDRDSEPISDDEDSVAPPPEAPKERMPLLKWFPRQGWGVHRDMEGMCLLLCDGHNVDLRDYAEAIQLNLTKPRSVVRAFSKYQYAHMLGHMMPSADPQVISDMFVHPEITTIQPKKDSYSYRNTAHVSDEYMNILQFRETDREIFKAFKKTVQVKEDPDKLSRETHLSVLRVPESLWALYDKDLRIQQHLAQLQAQ